MPDPWDIKAGGIPFEDDDNNTIATEKPPRGIFAEYPGATPKYALNIGEQSRDFRETMARMFMQVPNYNAFLLESKSRDNVQQIAAVLAGEAVAGEATTGGKGYVDFLLQSAQHSFQEKAQVVEVLADDHVAYFFGQAAPTFAYGGMLINTKQDDQASNMQLLYSNFGRGSQLAARNTLISLRYDGIFVSGVMMNLQYSLNAETEMAVPFSFNLLVKQFQIIPNPESGLVNLTNPFAVGPNGYKPFSQGSLNTGVVQSAPAMTPAAAGKAATTPAAGALSAADQKDVQINAGLSLIDKLTVTTTVKATIAKVLGN